MEMTNVNCLLGARRRTCRAARWWNGGLWSTACRVAGLSGFRQFRLLAACPGPAGTRCWLAPSSAWPRAEQGGESRWQTSVWVQPAVFFLCLAV